MLSEGREGEPDGAGREEEEQEQEEGGVEGWDEFCYRGEQR